MVTSICCEMIIIIADKRPIQRRSGREIVSMLRKGYLDIFCNRPMTPEFLPSWTHERTPPRNLDDRDTNELANVLGTIAEDLLLTQCDQVYFSVQKTIKMSGTIKERSTKSREIQTRSEEEMLRKKSTEELTHQNRYLFLATRSSDLILSITE